MRKFCSFCGAEVAMHVECDTGCPSCLATYRADIEAGQIPAGLPKEAYVFDTWKYIRQLERDVVAKRTTMEDAQKLVARAVGNAKKNYEDKLFMEAARKREQEELRNERSGPTGFLI